MMTAGEFEELAAKNRRAVLAYAYTCCADLSLADDIVQEAMLIAFEKREHYFREADFNAWLISIARNVWFRERERLARRCKPLDFVEKNAASFFAPEGYEEERWKEERAVLRRCIRKLDDTDRRLITTHLTGNMKYAELAARMKQTLSWVKVRIFRAKKQLLRCVKLAMNGVVRETV